MSPPTLEDIRTGLRRIGGLSPVVQEILPRLSDEDFGVDELTRLLGREPLLTARVLHLANSPFYGLSRRVGSLREAVLVLGFSNLRGLVLSVGLINSLAGADSIAARRSLETAVAAAALAKVYKLDPGLASTAGLLHNLGGLLLAHFAPDPWRSVQGGAGEPLAERLQRERQCFGFDHCQLGADLVAGWCFPDPIQAAIRHYPLPPDELVEPVVDVVHAAWVMGADPGTVIDNGSIRRLRLDTPAGEASLAAARQAMQAM